MTGEAIAREDTSEFQNSRLQWRIMIGFVLGPVGWYLRTRVEETPAFERTVAKQEVSRSPLRSMPP